MARRKTLLALAALAAALMLNSAADAQRINSGDRTASATVPFAAQDVTSFNTAWAIALLPNSRMLVTEKPGWIYLVT